VQHSSGVAWISDVVTDLNEQFRKTENVEVVPGLVEVEAAVPHLSPAVR
jgi:hypothetical protein